MKCCATWECKSHCVSPSVDRRAGKPGNREQVFLQHRMVLPFINTTPWGFLLRHCQHKNYWGVHTQKKKINKREKMHVEGVNLT